MWAEDFSWVTQDLQARVRAAPNEIVVLVAEADGRVISAAWLVFKPGTEFAGLWGGFFQAVTTTTPYVWTPSTKV